MVDPILRRKLKGRTLDVPFGRMGRTRANWAEVLMKKPVGNRHNSLATIPKTHISSRVAQDTIEDKMLYQIRHTPPGPRRDFLVRDYNMWVRNGKPTYGNFYTHDDKGRKFLDKEAEPIKTWHNGRPICNDVHDMLGKEREKRIRKIIEAGA